MTTAIRTNARGEVIVPFFQVGAYEHDLAAILQALRITLPAGDK